jgi:hypothetical protein
MEHTYLPRRLLSGGQTGVDRAALDFALSRGIPCGGWCPAGRSAEDGAIPARYPLRETPSPDPAERTAWNVRDSDATLVLFRERLRGGTEFTVDQARRQGRPCLTLDLSTLPAPDIATPGGVDALRRWIRAIRPAVLNLAGPRESEAPGIHQQSLEILRFLFHRR